MNKRTCFFLSITIFWFLSCSVDSPTGPGEDPDVAQNLLINEVDLNVPDAIEIYNMGMEPVDLEGWTLRTGDNVRVQRFILSSRVIAPGEYLLLIEGSESSSDSSLYLGESAPDLTNINWAPSLAGAVELLNKENITIDYVEWGIYPEMDASPEDWSGDPISLPPPGSSVGRDINSTDTNLSEDIIPLINTPGKVNDSHPIILTQSLKDGVLGSNYEDKIIVAGPAKPITFEMVSGALPDGLSLESDGTVKGILTKSGNFSFNIRVLDSQTPPKPALATISINSLSVDISFERKDLKIRLIN